VTLSARGCRIILVTPHIPPNSSRDKVDSERVTTAYTSCKGEPGEYPIRISNHSPTPARVMVRRILGHEAPQFLWLRRWVPSLRS
jgi:hypothetical protein